MTRMMKRKKRRTACQVPTMSPRGHPLTTLGQLGTSLIRSVGTDPQPAILRDAQIQIFFGISMGISSLRRGWNLYMCIIAPAEPSWPCYSLRASLIWYSCLSMCVIFSTHLSILKNKRSRHQPNTNLYLNKHITANFGFLFIRGGKK